MRRADKAVTDRADVEAILQEAQVLHLAMCRNGEPYVVPVFFGLSFMSGRAQRRTPGRFLQACRIGGAGRMAEPLVIEAEVDVEIQPAEAPCGWGARYRSVIGTGRAEQVEDPEEKKRGLEAIMRHHGGRGGRPKGRPRKATKARERPV